MAIIITIIIIPNFGDWKIPKSPNFRMFNILISLFGDISPKVFNSKNKEKIRQGCSRQSPLFFCSFSFKFVLRRTLPLITVIKH